MLSVAFVMNEPEIAAAISNKNGMIASDGVLQSGSGHPRAAGTFPRILGKYVRDVIALNKKNFRIFGPDETMSNRLNHVFDSTNRQWEAERLLCV